MSEKQDAVAVLESYISELREACSETWFYTVPVRAVLDELDRLRQATATAPDEVQRLRVVCGEAYQLAGTFSESFENPAIALDNLSAAANGDPIPHETFLPVVRTAAPQPAPTVEQVISEAQRWVDENWFSTTVHATRSLSLIAHLRATFLGEVRP